MYFLAISASPFLLRFLPTIFFLNFNVAGPSYGNMAQQPPYPPAFPAPDSTGTITAEHLKASLRSAVEDKVRRSLREEYATKQVFVLRLSMQVIVFYLSCQVLLVLDMSQKLCSLLKWSKLAQKVAVLGRHSRIDSELYANRNWHRSNPIRIYILQMIHQFYCFHNKTSCLLLKLPFSGRNAKSRQDQGGANNGTGEVTIQP